MQQCRNESGTLDPKQILHHFDNSRLIQPHTNEKLRENIMELEEPSDIVISQLMEDPADIPVEDLDEFVQLQNAVMKQLAEKKREILAREKKDRNEIKWIKILQSKKKED